MQRRLMQPQNVNESTSEEKETQTIDLMGKNALNMKKKKTPSKGGG